MTARILPFPSRAPFDFQERTFDTVLGILCAGVPSLPDMDRQILARRIALAISLNASVAAEQQLLAGPCPKIYEEPR